MSSSDKGQIHSYTQTHVYMQLYVCNCILPCSAQLLKQPHQTHSCSVAKNAKHDGALPKRRPRSAERNNELWRQVESVLAKSRADTRQTKWALNRCSCYAARPQATKVVHGARTAAVMWGSREIRPAKLKSQKCRRSVKRLKLKSRMWNAQKLQAAGWELGKSSRGAPIF